MADLGCMANLSNEKVLLLPAVLNARHDWDTLAGWPRDRKALPTAADAAAAAIRSTVVAGYIDGGEKDNLKL